MYPLTFHPHAPGQRIVTSAAIPGRRITTVRVPATDDECGYWVADVRDDEGIEMADHNVVRLIMSAITTLRGKMS